METNNAPFARYIKKGNTSARSQAFFFLSPLCFSPPVSLHAWRALTRLENSSHTARKQTRDGEKRGKNRILHEIRCACLPFSLAWSTGSRRRLTQLPVEEEENPRLKKGAFRTSLSTLDLFEGCLILREAHTHGTSSAAIL